MLHCPLCHGWEARDKALAVIGGDAQAFLIAVILRRMTDQLMLFTNGTHAMNDDQLQGAGVAVHERTPWRRSPRPATASSCASQTKAPSGATPSSCITPRATHELVARLDLDRSDDGRIQVDETGQTSIPGLYAAGDLCTFAQVTLAISTGAVAGSAASIVLAYEDLANKPSDY